MKKRVDVYLVLLFIWFTLDLTGLSISNFTLVRGTGFFGVNGIWWSVYSILLLIYFFREKAAEKLMLIFLLFWGITEYFKEWHSLIFNNKLLDENSHINYSYFPDIYHLILQGFIIISIIFIIKYILFEKKKTYFKFAIVENHSEEIEETLSINLE